MLSVGERLKEARLKKNASLEEVYKQTKIYPQVLEALEQDRAHNFLGFIYVKGFLKTYAHYLGLDAEELLKEYLQNQKVQTHPPQIILEKEETVAPKFNLFLILRIVFAVVLCFVLVVYFRFLLKRLTALPLEATKGKVKVEVMPAAQVKVKDLVLEVKTKDACWLQIKLDNQVIFQDTLSKGRFERWQAKESIELRIGKPEALEVVLNGRPIDLKKEKVKRSLLITHEGVVGK